MAAPYVQGVREDAAVAAIKADLHDTMRGVEQYVAVNHAWPESVEELEAGSDDTRSADVEHCWSFTVEPSRWRDAYVPPVAAHRAMSRRVHTMYPLWSGSIREYDGGQAGC